MLRSNVSGQSSQPITLVLLFEHHGEQNQAVAQRTGHRNRVQSGELIRQQVVPGHAPERTEVLRIGTGVNGADRYHETHAIGRGDFAAAPGVRKGDAILCCHQSSVAGGNRFVAQIVLLDPGDPIPAQRRRVVTVQVIILVRAVYVLRPLQLAVDKGPWVQNVENIRGIR